MFSPISLVHLLNDINQLCTANLAIAIVLIYHIRKSKSITHTPEYTVIARRTSDYLFEKAIQNKTKIEKKLGNAIFECKILLKKNVATVKQDSYIFFGTTRAKLTNV